MNREQIEKAIGQGWPEPKFKVGDIVQHWSREEASAIVRIEIDEKWLSDYNVKGWTYMNDINRQDAWWGRDDDLTLVSRS